MREGAILPRGPYAQTVDTIDPGELRLDVYPAATATTFALHDDAGDGDGPAARTAITVQATASGATLEVAARDGAWVPLPRTLDVWVHRVDGPVTSVRVDGAGPRSRAGSTRRASRRWGAGSSTRPIAPCGSASPTPRRSGSRRTTTRPSPSSAARGRALRDHRPPGTPMGTPISVG
ncbi:MAG: DUF5110 domain-containing protein [Sandaracinaceae bacterium]